MAGILAHKWIEEFWHSTPSPPVAVAYESSEIFVYAYAPPKVVKKHTLRGHTGDVNDLIFFMNTDKKYPLTRGHLSDNNMNFFQTKGGV